MIHKTFIYRVNTLITQLIMSVIQMIKKQMSMMRIWIKQIDLQQFPKLRAWCTWSYQNKSKELNDNWIVIARLSPGKAAVVQNIMLWTWQSEMKTTIDTVKDKMLHSLMKMRVQLQAVEEWTHTLRRNTKILKNNC